MDNFYVYMYLREKRSKYGDVGTPYYIGKGKGMRAFCKNRASKPPNDRTRIVMAMENVSEEQAFAEEKRLILIHGRIDLGTGYLRNKTNGGEGQCGAIVSEETRAKMAKAHKGNKYRLGLKNTEEHKQKIRKANLGKKCPWAIAQAIKMGNSRKGLPVSDETRKKLSDVARGRKHPRTKEWTEKIAAAQRGISSTNAGSFRAGQVSWNAGTKGIMKPNATTFVKGQVAWNSGRIGAMGIHWTKREEYRDRFKKASG